MSVLCCLFCHSNKICQGVDVVYENCRRQWPNQCSSIDSMIDMLSCSCCVITMNKVTSLLPTHEWSLICWHPPHPWPYVYGNSLTARTEYSPQTTNIIPRVVLAAAHTHKWTRSVEKHSTTTLQHHGRRRGGRKSNEHQEWKGMNEYLFSLLDS